jgi:hypothetical protein
MITDKFFWTDSQTVLSWIQSDHRKYTQFVANRVSEILDSCSMKSFRWIPGTKNVADEATKRLNKINLTSNGRWMSGPQFLKLPECDWPAQSKPRDCDEELRTTKVCVITQAKII